MLISHLLLPSVDGPFPLAGYRMQLGSKPRMRAAAGLTKCGLHRVFTPLGQFISRPLQKEEYLAPRGQGYLNTSGEDQIEDLANYEASFGAPPSKKKEKEEAAQK